MIMLKHVCVYIYIYIYIHTYVYIYIYICITNNHNTSRGARGLGGEERVDAPPGRAPVPRGPRVQPRQAESRPTMLVNSKLT